MSVAQLLAAYDAVVADALLRDLEQIHRLDADLVPSNEVLVSCGMGQWVDAGAEHFFSEDPSGDQQVDGVARAEIVRLCDKKVDEADEPDPAAILPFTGLTGLGPTGGFCGLVNFASNEELVASALESTRLLRQQCETRLIDQFMEREATDKGTPYSELGGDEPDPCDEDPACIHSQTVSDNGDGTETVSGTTSDGNDYSYVRYRRGKTEVVVDSESRTERTIVYDSKGNVVSDETRTIPDSLPFPAIDSKKVWYYQGDGEVVEVTHIGGKLASVRKYDYDSNEGGWSISKDILGEWRSFERRRSRDDFAPIPSDIHEFIRPLLEHDDFGRNYGLESECYVDEECSSCVKFLAFSAAVELACTGQNPHLCERFARRSACCDVGVIPTDPRVVYPDPTGDLTCGVSEDWDAKQAACDATCSLAGNGVDCYAACLSRPESGRASLIIDDFCGRPDVECLPEMFDRSTTHLGRQPVLGLDAHHILRIPGLELRLN